MLRYELKTECGQICAFFVTAGVGLNALKYSWVDYEVGPASIYQKKAT